ncbi:MAG: right-handed parallel beta-helix repeat-containing protein [Planctomycetota bacterium]
MGCCQPDACAVPEEPQAALYVATTGDDAWSGTLPAANAAKTDGPFATLARARDAVRKLKAGGEREGPIVVTVRGGTYYLAEPLRLGPADSGTADQPIIYCAWPGEEVTLSGGRPIDGWRKGEGALWVADVPEVKAGRWYFRQLFVGGERQIRARTPNFDPEHPYTGGWAFATEPMVEGRKVGRFGETLANIHTPGDTFLWEVEVPADGDYALWLCYGAKNKPYGRTDMAGRTTMQADDAEPVPLANLPDTGGWGTFRWSRTATLKLTKGRHKLRWTNVKGGGLNFDAFALCDAPGWAPKGTKLRDPGKDEHLVVVQAESYVSCRAKDFRLAKGRGGYARDKLYFAPGDIGRWPRSPEPEIHIFPRFGWVNAILSVQEIDLDKRVVHLTNRNCSQEIWPGNRYFVENVFEALDQPGEWSLDRAAGRLYYWPKEANFAGRGVVAPRLDRLIEIAGEKPPDETETIEVDGETVQEAAKPVETQFAEHIVLRGFTFRHTTYSLEVPSVYTPDDGTVHLRWARHCVVEDCRFLGVGGYAARLSDEASHNHILGNTVEEAGQGGVLLVGSDTQTQPHDNVIAGNRIQHCGTIWKHVAGVYVTTGSGNRIAHNTITDVPRYGISLKTFGPGKASHRNVIEWNRILRTNLETNDTGAIETLGRDREDTGNVIRYNLMLDSVGLKTTETGDILRPYYSWGIYLDDYSSGTVCTGNIVARTYRGGIHVHLGRNNVFENNILVDGHNQQVEFNGRQFMASNRFVRNIVLFHRGNLVRVRAWHDAVLAACDRNVYWKIGEDLRETDGDLTPKGSLAKWREAGYDQHSVVADPLFVDPDKDDYRLQPDSPALKLGFEPIDVSKIGVAGYQRPEGVP